MASKMGGVQKVFSPRTLGEFEAASASIPLRQLDRAFQNAAIRRGEDPGGPEGARRAQFRRYIAGVDQNDPQQLDRLGDALGALIEEVAVSKQDFLVKAAERDGFLFADGAFRPAGTTPNAFAVSSVEDLALIEDRGRRLHLLANDAPNDAIAGARALVESVCRTVLRLVGEPASAKTSDLADLAKTTLNALEPIPAGTDAKKGAAVVRKSFEQLAAVVTSLGELRDIHGLGRGSDGKRKGPSPRHARLAIGAAVAFAGFVAETYREHGEMGHSVNPRPFLGRHPTAGRRE